MRTVTKAEHTDCRKNSPHCQKPFALRLCHYLSSEACCSMLLRLLTDFFLVSPATFVPWTHLLPPSLFPSPATDLVPSTSKGKFLCFPATLLAVRELLLGAIRSKTWAPRRRSAHYSYHSTHRLPSLTSFLPSFLPAFLHSFHTFHETKKTTNPLCRVIHMTHIFLFSIPSRLTSSPTMQSHSPLLLYKKKN